MEEWNTGYAQHGTDTPLPIHLQEVAAVRLIRSLPRDNMDKKVLTECNVHPQLRRMSQLSCKQSIQLPPSNPTLVMEPVSAIWNDSVEGPGIYPTSNQEELKKT
eukprot:scaffold5537_cov54-Cyclotella_meneghiniana.AAC.1